MPSTDPAPHQVDLHLLCALRDDGRTRAGTVVRRLCPSEAAVARLPRPAEAEPRPAGRPVQAIARISYGPVPLDFEQLAARVPAVQWGLSLAGDADLELHLACVDQRELRSVTADLRRAGAARVHVELVLRRLVPGGPA